MCDHVHAWRQSTGRLARTTKTPPIAPGSGFSVSTGGAGGGPLERAGLEAGQEEVPEPVRPLFPPAMLLHPVQSPDALLCTAPSPLLLGVKEMLQSSGPRRSRDIYTTCSPPSQTPVQCPSPPHEALGAQRCLGLGISGGWLMTVADTITDGWASGSQGLLAPHPFA